LTYQKDSILLSKCIPCSHFQLQWSWGRCTDHFECRVFDSRYWKSWWIYLCQNLI